MNYKMNGIFTETILGLLLALKIPMLWQLKDFSDFESFWYLLGWSLFSVGLVLGRNEMVSVCVGVLSNICLSLCYNSPNSVSIVSYYLSMLTFGYSLGPFYLTNTFYFYVGSILGCGIGGTCAYYGLWLTDYNFLLYFVILVSAMPTFTHCWCKKSKIEIEEILLLKNQENDSFILYPPHYLAIALVFGGYFFSSASMGYFFFIIPIFVSEETPIQFTYLLYGILFVSPN